MMKIIDDIANVINGDYITAIGVVSSISSLIISVFVLLAVKKIRRFYAFTARVPEINKKLVETASAISDSLNVFNGFTTGLCTLLGDAEVNLISLSKKTDGDLKRKVDLLVKEITAIDSPSWLTKVKRYVDSETPKPEFDSQKQALQRIYVALYKITGECREIYEDARWER